MKSLAWLPAAGLAAGLPHHCVVCGRSLRRDPGWPLCPTCGAGLPRVRGAVCQWCGRPLLSERTTCLSCRRREDHAVAVTALFQYSASMVSLLSAYKSHGRRSLAGFFAACLATALAGRLVPFCLVPVPPRPGKIHRSGWDQVEELGRWLVRRYRLPVCRCLRRLKGGVQQKTLDAAARRVNMAGRFVLARKLPEGRELILIDDVSTTGATLEACAIALRTAGALQVSAIVLAAD
ncbi:MAG TPA: ComF family protein [Spirochaetaceae bacterium]|nr:ComF family protein [Spirochaetaceae bacterium]HBO40602.1 ComF family protein [Spirochaetaceae bacterium]HCQ86053.1 ComF family protein [Spirochaetaceae bacterium]